MKEKTTSLDLHIPAISEAKQLADLLRLLSRYRQLRPKKFGEHQPFRTMFDPNNIDEIAQRMLPSRSFYWDCTIHREGGGITSRFGRGTQTGEFMIWTYFEKLETPQVLTDLLQDAARRFGAIYGYVYHRSGEDARKAAISDSSPRIGLARWQLVRCIPDLYWANVFGPAYVALFGGSEQVRSAPAPIVKELAPDLFYIQLSDSILDFTTRYAEIDAVRERVKQHLGADCFFDYEAKFTRKYRVPDLGWEEPARPPMTVEEIIESLKEGKMRVVDTTGGEYRKALE